jgi:cobalt-zinc-cadmium efflux system outer membrane protein
VTEAQQPISAPAAQPITPLSTPPYGTYEVPSGPEDDGPPNGLTLDSAIDTTLQRSLDLRAKYFEIPQAKADILQASLRLNPIFYQDGQLLPNVGRQFTRSIPGGPSQYDTNVTFPLDVTHKRQARTVVAVRAERVLEAQYQDAVRQRIDDVYGAYVNALAARQAVRYAIQSVKGLNILVAATEDLHRRGQITLAELNRAKILHKTAQLTLVDAEAAYRQAKLDLGSLMNLTNDQARSIELRGTIQDVAAPPPPLDELRKIALAARPDINSFRLGVKRAEADVKLARANRYSEVYLLYQPYTFQDNTPYGLKSAYSWALGVTVPLPVFNRNQGGIARANLNLTQTQIELSDQERQVLIDVEKAVTEYEVTRREVEELRNDLVPTARRVRDDVYVRFQGGEDTLMTYINAQLDFNQVVKQYLDTAVRHRRSMLSLNTAVGQRIMP